MVGSFNNERAEVTMSRLSPIAPVLMLAGVLTCHPAEAVQRTFVASYGSDANTATNCGFAHPCRAFMAALGVTDSGGEIIALDAAGYGLVVVSKSVSIVASPGVYAGISAAAGSAVTIASPNVNVVLRGLSINGVGGSRGINMTDGASLTIENCVLSNFTSAALYISAPASVRVSDSVMRGNYDGIFVAGGATLEVSRSRFVGNIDAGIWVNGDTPSTTTRAVVSDSVATGNAFGFTAANTSPSGSGASQLAISRSTVSHNSAYGVLAEADSGTALVTISGSLIINNGTGLFNLSGTFESQGDNTVRQNSTNSAGSITVAAGL
jgi:hypothetical protein